MCSVEATVLVLGICPEGHIRERRLCYEHAATYAGLYISSDLKCYEPGCGKHVILTEACSLEEVQ
jgi:hypothetical protein